MSTLHEERAVLGTLDAVSTLEGGGFLVRRPFPTARLDYIGPFLLLDEMGPADNAPGEAKGAPDHPHRGFETVTYVLDGEIEHRDSQGNRGLITPGDVQWMTAGSGIVHSEMPSAKILQQGGRAHGFQLWVNLPRKAKWHRPRYQDLEAKDMPVVEFAGGSAVVIAGHTHGVDGAADTFLPVNYFHLKVYPEDEVALEIEPGHQAFVYVFRGDGTIGKNRESVSSGQMAVFEEEAGQITVIGGSEGLEAMVGSSEPLDEPVARYGPFVMNTREEIVQAFDDYREGRMGTIEPELSPSMESSAKGPT
ncbi:MAG: pirin family protein [Actinobacteria bacterium]|nr:pirin family protein [Actinomycetota bacterium]